MIQTYCKQGIVPKLERLGKCLLIYISNIHVFFFVFFARKLLIFYQKYFKCNFRNQEKIFFLNLKYC